MSAIELREITMDNFHECIGLSVDDDQRGFDSGSGTGHIDRLRSDPGCRRIRTSFEPTNAVADMLYNSLGFHRTGEVDGGETVVVLELPDRS